MYISNIDNNRLYVYRSQCSSSYDQEMEQNSKQHMVGIKVQVAVVIINNNGKILLAVQLRGKSTQRSSQRDKIVRPNVNTWLAGQQHKGSLWKRPSLFLLNKGGEALTVRAPFSPALTLPLRGGMIIAILELQKLRLSEGKHLSQGCKTIKWQV